jgi:hypothetical protein
MERTLEELQRQELERTASEANRRYKEHLGTGVGLGLLSAGAAAVAGAVCPLCVVAVPALVGSGLYHRYKQHCSERAMQDEDEPLVEAIDPRDGTT